MKMKMKNGFIEDDASIEGLFDCTMRYEIKETKATIEWKGPKLPMDMWNEILSFFQWCYNEHKSECQVRLYVSPTLQTWKAYAFPQEAKTGMTARELDNDLKRQQIQELQLIPPDWFAFGTVHHHCSAGAFQSSTDEENEKNVDGLHITIGNMNVDPKKGNYDIHARFYRKGLVIKNERLDLSWFVDTSALLAECPEKFRPYLPSDWAHKQAKRLLTTPPAELVFPKIWEDNVIEIPTPPSTFTGGVSIPTGGSYSYGGPSQFSGEFEPLHKRAEAAWKEIIYKCVTKEIDPDIVKRDVEDLAMEEFSPHIICMACRHHKVDPDDLMREMPADLEKEMAEELLSRQHEKNVAPKKEDKSDPKSNTTGENGKKEGSAAGGAPRGGTDPDLMEEEAWRHWHMGM